MRAFFIPFDYASTMSALSPAGSLPQGHCVVPQIAPTPHNLVGASLLAKGPEQHAQIY